MANSQTHLSLLEHLADVFNDDCDDKVCDGDSDHEDEEHEETLDNAITASDTPDCLKCEVIVKVEFSSHHVDYLEEGGQGVVEDVVIPERQMEREAEGEEDGYEDHEGEHKLSEDHNGKVNIHPNLWENVFFR